jgi:hypothetical protein
MALLQGKPAQALKDFEDARPLLLDAAAETTTDWAAWQRRPIEAAPRNAERRIV